MRAAFTHGSTQHSRQAPLSDRQPHDEIAQAGRSRPARPFGVHAKTLGSGAVDMETVVVTSNPRADLKIVDRFAKLGVATTHEASGRAPNLMKTYMRPAWPGAQIAGTVVTALAQPGDHWMIHVAAGQC